MTRVKTAAFKLHLGKYLRDVRGGEEIVILDRDEPIARVVAFKASDADPLAIDAPEKNAPAPGTITIKPIRAMGPVTELLLRERQTR